MDIFSHALWGATIVRTKTLVFGALLAGAAPDLLGSGPGFLYLLLAHHRIWSTTTWILLPGWMVGNYHLWHSLLGAGIFFMLLLFLAERFWILILPFLLHIFVDLFTHQGYIWYRLFFPFVRYDINRISGINWWEHRWIWVTNFGLLILINGIIRYRYLVHSNQQS